MSASLWTKALAAALLGATGWFASPGAAVAEPGNKPSERIVSLGGSITEILYLLDEDDALVGVDTTSIYPPETGELPKVGYLRQLSAEGVLSLNPTMVIGSDDAGPPHVVDQLRQAGLNIVLLPNEKSPESLAATVKGVAEAVGKQEQAKPLLARLEKEWAAVKASADAKPAKPKVLFIYARAGGILSVSGTGTAADAVIALIGGQNAVTGYQGYKPLTAEAVVEASPDVILLSESGLESQGGLEGLLQIPGISLTPAGRDQRVLTASQLPLLGFGPRTPAALAELARALDFEEEGSPVANAFPSGPSHDK
ncbi:MAG: hemin ABC transporter substrate-binding protein [Verrucomicrobiota bacterium]